MMHGCCHCCQALLRCCFVVVLSGMPPIPHMMHGCCCCYQALLRCCLVVVLSSMHPFLYEFIIFPVKQSLGVMYRNQYVCLLRDIILSKHVIWIFLKFYTFINYHMKMYSFFIFHHFTCILFYLWFTCNYFCTNNSTILSNYKDTCQW